MVNKSFNIEIQLVDYHHQSNPLKKERKKKKPYRLNFPTPWSIITTMMKAKLIVMIGTGPLKKSKVSQKENVSLKEKGKTYSFKVP